MNELLVIVTLLIQIQNGQPKGTATGFFYMKNHTVYLVTNRHVVIDENKNLKPDLLRARVHTDPSDLTKNIDLDIPLYANGTARWHVHKDYSAKRMDIAVVELDQARMKSGVFIKALSSQNFLPANFLVAPGEDVMVLGFPRGLSDTTYNLPINRSAMISSAYKINFQGLPLFLVDSNLHPGMSGSPVMTKPKNMWSDTAGNTNIQTGTDRKRTRLNS